MVTADLLILTKTTDADGISRMREMPAGLWHQTALEASASAGIALQASMPKLCRLVGKVQSDSWLQPVQLLDIPQMLYARSTILKVGWLPS